MITAGLKNNLVNVQTNKEITNLGKTIRIIK